MPSSILTTPGRNWRTCEENVDILGSVGLLVLLSPVLVCIGWRSNSRRKADPVSTDRIGQFGQPFMFLKFRSMYTNADSRVHEKYVQEFILQKQEWQ